MRLYHGSNILIDGINLAMCRPYSVNVQGATRSKPRDFSDFQLILSQRTPCTLPSSAL